jgi:hypothetical protein
VAALAALAVVATGGTDAAFTSAATSGGNVVSAAPDFRAPTIGATAIAKTAGGTAGFIRKSGTYRVYANVTDTGNPASGVASVTADVSALTSGQTAAPLTAGSYTVGGVTYNYASATLTAGASITEGAKAFTVRATDGASNSGTASGSVTVDNTAPAGTDVQPTNGGTTTRRIDAGDGLVLTLTEPIEPATVLSGWTGSSTNVVVRLVNGVSGNDSLQIWNASNTAQLPLGTVDLGQTGYTDNGIPISYGASGTPSTMTVSGNTITIVFGTPSTTPRRGSNARRDLTWNPSSTPTDRAGNSLSTAAVTESDNDRDF